MSIYIYIHIYTQICTIKFLYPLMDRATEGVQCSMSTSLFGQFRIFTNMFGDVPHTFET